MLKKKELSDLILVKHSAEVLFEPYGIKLAQESPCPLCKHSGTDTLSIRPDSSWSCTECNAAGDTFVDFYECVEKLSPKATISGLYSKYIRKTINELLIAKHQEALTNNRGLLVLLEQATGINADSVEKFRLGFDNATQRLLVPVLDEHDFCVNILKCKVFDKKEGFQCEAWEPQYKSNILYPANNLSEEKLLLVGDIRDVIVAQQNGYRAITPSAGVMTWGENFFVQLVGKTITIVYPANDYEISVVTAQRKRELYSYTRRTKVVVLPISHPRGGLYHYFIEDKKNKKQFEGLLKATSWWETTDIKKFARVLGESKAVTLADATDSENFFKKIYFKAMVNSKADSPFLPPSEVKITCRAGYPKCAKCHIAQAPKNTNGEYEYILHIEPDNKVFSLLIDVSYKSAQTVVRDLANLSKGCNVTLEWLETRGVETVVLIPDLLYQAMDEKPVSRIGYHIGIGLEPGRVYKMEGHIAVNPKRTQSVIIVTKAIPVADSLDDFFLDGQARNELKKFQVEPKLEIIEEHLRNLYEDYANHITKIYGREDILLAIDLVFFSVLSFHFNGTYMHRGWLDVLVFSDPQIGKTKTAEQLTAFYELGEIATGETSTIPGLVGGLTQVEGVWMVSWGKLVTNNRKLLIIDELTGIKTEDIGLLSRVRSEGVAELVKIRRDCAPAKTRLIALSNTRKGDKLHSYGYGVEAMVPLVGKMEDIARFDYALAISSDEVALDVLHQSVPSGDIQKFTREESRQLVLWCWTRNASQVIFTDDCTKYILEVAVPELIKKYSSKIPLVQAENIRFKIARVAAAIAGRLYSTDETFERLVIHRAHAQYAVKMLQRFYDKDAMNYDEYSAAVFYENNIKDEEVIRQAIITFCHTNIEELLRNLLHSEYITVKQLSDWIGDNFNNASSLMSIFAQCRVHKHVAHNKYRKSPAGIKFLRRTLRNKKWLKDNYKDTTVGTPFDNFNPREG